MPEEVAVIIGAIMALVSGTRLGPYEILSLLGAGGMGEVYRVRDTRLDRTVAIKILSQLSTNPAQKQRFEREAKAISCLNHPNICTLHDVGHHDGIDYLVMECLEGETLAKRLEKGPLPVDQVLKYGAEIADALDKAHRSGVIHRDLKPSNIMLTSTGAKLLDFGLAKPASALANVATMTASAVATPVTEQGTIVGTFQYMSPEQVEGRELDCRSDIFSLGAVLYEMVTGQHAFEGKTQLSVASHILEKEPAPISTLKPLTPPALDHAIRNCLVKDPDLRWQTARDLASELKWIAESGSQTPGSTLALPKTKSRQRIAWLIAGAGVVTLIVAGIWWRNSKPARETMYFAAPMSFPAQDIAVSPNGHTMAIVAYLESARKNAIWIYELGSQEARSLAETEGATYPFWSPDSRWLAFFADGKLKKLDVSGGPVQTICEAPSGRGGTWNKDGVIVFTPEASGGGSLHRVSASGGTVKQISNLDTNRRERSHRWPRFLPDGRHYLYLAANLAGQKGVDAIFVGSLDSNEKHFVAEAAGNAAYAAPGYLLFYRDKALLAQRFDLKRFELTGEAMVLLTDVQYEVARKAVFDISDTGLLVAQTGGGVAISRLVWFDRNGKEMGVVGKPGVYDTVALAPNGQSVAVSVIDVTDIAARNTDVWTYDLKAGSAKRLTFDPGEDMVPIWSPDSTQVVFSSNRQASYTPQSNNVLYLKNSDGRHEERPILQGGFNNFPSDWSRDGKYILCMRDADLWLANVPELKSTLFLKAPSASVVRNGQFSPDGRWVAYASNETGKWEIYVISFPDGDGKQQISIGGGEQPRWRGDGKELFYLSPHGHIMSVPVTTGANFDHGAPVALFQATPRQPAALYDRFVYDVSRDGKQFLINTPVKQPETAPMSIILNWDAKLNR